MALLPIFILALVQGITEFLPISSSGHLVLIHALGNDNMNAGWDDDLMMDVAVHVGTLFSVLVYFRRDLWMMVASMLRGFKGGDGRDLFVNIVVASVPVIIAGLAIHIMKPSWLRTLEVMAWATLIFGVLLWWVDSKKSHVREMKDMNIKDAIFIGISQSLALIPGTSRSGITMTAARFLGFSRSESAHFSLLLAIVAIVGAGTLEGRDLVASGNMVLTYDALIAAALSFVSGLVAVTLMMKWLEKSTFTLFAIYRIILGVALLALIYSGAFNSVTLVSP